MVTSRFAFPREKIGLNYSLGPLYEKRDILKLEDIFLSCLKDKAIPHPFPTSKNCPWLYSSFDTHSQNPFLSARFSQASKECGEYVVAECGSFAQNSSSSFSMPTFIIHALFSNRPLKNRTREERQEEAHIRKKPKREGRLQFIQLESIRLVSPCYVLPSRGPSRKGGKPDLPSQNLLWERDVQSADQSLQTFP